MFVRSNDSRCYAEENGRATSQNSLNKIMGVLFLLMHHPQYRRFSEAL